MEVYERISELANTAPDNVVGFRLSSGESILAIVRHVSDAGIDVSKPILYMIQSGQLGFSSWICNGKNGFTMIPIGAVTIVHEVEDQVREQYLEVVEEKRIQKASPKMTKLVGENGKPINE